MAIPEMAYFASARRLARDVIVEILSQLPVVGINGLLRVAFP